MTAGTNSPSVACRTNDGRDADGRRSELAGAVERNVFNYSTGSFRPPLLEGCCGRGGTSRPDRPHLEITNDSFIHINK